MWFVLKRIELVLSAIGKKKVTGLGKGNMNYGGSFKLPRIPGRFESGKYFGQNGIFAKYLMAFLEEGFERVMI